MKPCQTGTATDSAPEIKLDPPQVAQTTAKNTAIIHLTIPREEMPNVMGPAIHELIAAISAQGVKPAGPIFAHHLRMEPGIFNFEVSIPVSAPISASGRVKPSEWPAQKVARTIYTGPYEGLPLAWGQFMEWIESNELPLTEDLYETYLKGPESSEDPSEWQTELSRPLQS